MILKVLSFTIRNIPSKLNLHSLAHLMHYKKKNAIIPLNIMVEVSRSGLLKKSLILLLSVSVQGQISTIILSLGLLLQYL